nr:hypothetical protein [Tanacetum cinerariifolium]
MVGLKKKKKRKTRRWKKRKTQRLPEVEAEDKDETKAAIVGTITWAPYHVHPFSGTTYVGSGSSRKVFAPRPMGKDVDTLHCKVKSLALKMFERANTKYSILKRLSETDRYLGALDTDWRSETQERYELNSSIPPSVDEERPIKANGDVTTPNDAQPSEPQGSPPYDSMTSLADKAILSGADNRPPMLEKDMYDSWKSRMEQYMLNRQQGRMILEFVENGPLIWLTVKENGVTRPKKYSELSATEAIQAD